MGKAQQESDRRLLLTATLGVVFFCGLGAIFFLLLSAPPKQPGPPLYPEPPLYEGATVVTVTKGDALGAMPGIQRERVIRFKTGDAPQTVLSFYESTLTKAGWHPFARVNAEQRNFYWTDGSIATGLYKANITAMPSVDGKTEVTLETGIDTGSDNR